MQLPTGRMTAFRYKIGEEVLTFYAHNRKDADEASSAWAKKRKLTSKRSK